jgi:hypothetical protein
MSPPLRTATLGYAPEAPLELPEARGEIIFQKNGCHLSESCSLRLLQLPQNDSAAEKKDSYLKEMLPEQILPET